MSSKRYILAGEGRMGDLRLSCEPHFFSPFKSVVDRGGGAGYFKSKRGRKPINLSLKRLYDSVAA